MSDSSSSLKIKKTLGDHLDRRSLLDSIVGYFWSRHHITPLAMARLTGPLYKVIVTAFVKRSDLYRGFDSDCIGPLAQYAYGNVRHKTSMERLLAYCIGGS